MSVISDATRECPDLRGVDRQTEPLMWAIRQLRIRRAMTLQDATDTARRGYTAVANTLRGQAQDDLVAAQRIEQVIKDLTGSGDSSG